MALVSRSLESARGVIFENLVAFSSALMNIPQVPE